MSMTKPNKSADLELRPARGSDLPQVESLLTTLKLPLDGVPDDLRHFRVAVNDNELAGVAGLEIGGVGDALLRSVAVHPDYRDLGVARKLVDALMRDASELEISTIYLLTTTAADYFRRRGFVQIDRTEVPTGLAATAEFQGACPASATVMKLELAVDSPTQSR
jgi:N-acetylglutamate synthase-like GNAT family acetyltransferase